MKQFKTDEIKNTTERAAKIAAIQKIVPDFNGRGRTDAYIESYYETAMSIAQTEETNREVHSPTHDASIITELKNKRLNLRETDSTVNKVHETHDSNIIAELKNKRLNLKGY